MMYEEGAVSGEQEIIVTKEEPTPISNSGGQLGAVVEWRKQDGCVGALIQSSLKPKILRLHRPDLALIFLYPAEPADSAEY
jgi:hypothetical protein